MNKKNLNICFTVLAILVVLLLVYYLKPQFIYNEGSVQGPQTIQTIQNRSNSTSGVPSGLPLQNESVITDPNAGGVGGSVSDVSDSIAMNQQISNPEMADPAMTPAVQGLNLASCYPKDQLTAEELLPQDSVSTQWAQTYPSGVGSLKEKNFLQAGHHIGINTVGQTLRNANLQLRSEFPNPQSQVSPWLQSTIQPDMNRRPFEIGGC